MLLTNRPQATLEPRNLGVLCGQAMGLLRGMAKKDLLGPGSGRSLQPCWWAAFQGGGLPGDGSGHLPSHTAGWPDVLSPLPCPLISAGFCRQGGRPWQGVDTNCGHLRCSGVADADAQAALSAKALHLAPTGLQEQSSKPSPSPTPPPSNPSRPEVPLL